MRAAQRDFVAQVRHQKFLQVTFGKNPIAAQAAKWELNIGAMKNCAPISGRMVCSNADYIVFSHTGGILLERNKFEQAKEFWESELARHAERGHMSDALLFQWSDGQWVMFGNLYDLELERTAQHQNPS